MLFFVPPSEILLPALEDYRRESGSDCDGSAGLGEFSDLSDWLARVRLLSSGEAERRGWFRTEVFVALESPGVCSLMARADRDPALLAGMKPAGIGNVRLSRDPIIEERAGHIGYHVRPSARGRGIGTAILSHAVALCRERGIGSPVLAAELGNTASLKTAARCGFGEPVRRKCEDGSEILLLRFQGKAD